MPRKRRGGDSELTHSAGRAEFDSLPDDWDVVSLEEAAKAFYGGGTPSTSHAEYWGGDLHWTTSAHISGLYLSEGQKRITHQGLENSYTRLIPKGNLLIGTRVGVGKVAVNLVDVAISQDLTGAIVDLNKFHPEFLAYCLLSDGPQAVFQRQTRGTTIKGIPREDLKLISVTRPSIPEQRAIAHVLSRIQAAAQAQATIVRRARELKRALMAKLFTEGLRGEALKETEIGLIPESWHIIRLGDRATIQSGGTPSRGNSEYWGGKIPWVKTGEINYSVIRDTEEKITQAGLENSSARMFSVGTLLMAMYGQGITRGRVAILGIEAATNQACAAILPDSTLTIEYLFSYLTYAYERVRNLGHGAQQKNLSGEIIKTIKLPVPSLDEQQEIARTMQAVDARITTAERKQARLDELFRAMLGQLMTGRIRVREKLL